VRLVLLIFGRDGGCMRWWEDRRRGGLGEKVGRCSWQLWPEVRISTGIWGKTSVNWGRGQGCSSVARNVWVSCAQCRERITPCMRSDARRVLLERDSLTPWRGPTKTHGVWRFFIQAQLHLSPPEVAVVTWCLEVPGAAPDARLLLALDLSCFWASRRNSS